MMSIVACMGFVNQATSREGDPFLGDEFEHLAGFRDLSEDHQLVIVDRAWPRRWNRICSVFGRGTALGAVRYIPPKPSEFVIRGFRAASAMRNSGAICASGDLLIFLDDFISIDAEVFDQVWRAYQTENVLLHPFLQRIDTDAPLISGEFSDHNPGIYMATAEQFAGTGGFEENLDGAYGEEDTEWQMRLDMLIRVGNALDDDLERERMSPIRVRREGLTLTQTPHENGRLPEKLDPPWPIDGLTVDQRENLRNALRCNKALFQHVLAPDIRSGTYDRGNQPLSGYQRQLLAETSCSPDCWICNRGDRAQQCSSYYTYQPKPDIGEMMADWKDLLEGQRGMINPW
jgi:hypothetical protein